MTREEKELLKNIGRGVATLCRKLQQSDLFSPLYDAHSLSDCSRDICNSIADLDDSEECQKKTDVLDKIGAEIREWYWQADKQALAEDPCVADAMVDLFIRTIDKYKAEIEDMR